MNEAEQRLLGQIAGRYLSSASFNGMPLADLAPHESDWSDFLHSVTNLVRGDYIGVLFHDADENPGILRFGFEPVDTQVRKLQSLNDLTKAWAYPRPRYLQSHVSRASYEGQPYTLCLALGEPQYAFRAFDLAVLEKYRNDPRYWYQNDDVEGHISISDEFYGSESMAEKDKVLLESFGFAHDANHNRVVAVFLRHLSRLSAEHQQLWRLHEVPGDYKLHPDYLKNVMGDWGPRGVSVFAAILIEIHVINRIAKAIGRPPLFRTDYGPNAENKPSELCFMVRPTSKEFYDSVLALDKVLSDNISKRFFGDEVPAQSEKDLPDGRIEVLPKGTLTMLDEWLRRSVRLADWMPWETALAALRKVRRLRQRPAHSLDDNTFDLKYLREQRELAGAAYHALQTLRLILSGHPKARHVRVPECLEHGPIWIS